MLFFSLSRRVSSRQRGPCFFCGWLPAGILLEIPPDSWGFFGIPGIPGILRLQIVWILPGIPGILPDLGGMESQGIAGNPGYMVR